MWVASRKRRQEGRWYCSLCDMKERGKEEQGEREKKEGKLAGCLEWYNRKKEGNREKS